ncbi:uroporphyrinogen-III synthase [Brevibacillus nitrificans]|uniref:uroporphyrinogen-III synthase n=1 Tax=Brevibacillus nitrificans TaxID=651560 RepID=UPI002862163F|nr:uroporphyrinogen-III synthase [Brevibacillus nitrificans]MDR7315000.1 uroporphyrinogen-III synthase [Brevibacillus nitrificans]
MSMTDAQLESAGPLAGKRIMVTRARSQVRELVGKIEALGGEAYAFPLLKMVAPDDPSQVDEAIAQLETFDWLIFTSVNGVQFFLERMRAVGAGIETIRAEVAAVGPKTAAALQKEGLTVAVIPSDYVAEGLLSSLHDRLVPGQRVLLPRADIARKTLPQELVRLGLEVTEVDVYHTVIDAELAPEAARRIQNHDIDGILFTSSSTVTHFVQAMAPFAQEGWLDQVTIACIGPITAKTAQKNGLKVQVVATEFTVEGLLTALIENLGGNGHGTNI